MKTSKEQTIEETLAFKATKMVIYFALISALVVVSIVMYSSHLHFGAF